MKDDYIAYRSTQTRISFSNKIILIVLMILALSQALGTYLSVLSFEKTFLKAITAKYEILGKDLKRKIEGALRFGKTLDRFVGMDRMVKKLYRQSEDIREIFLTDSHGKILFTSGKAEFVVAKGVAEKGTSTGKVILGHFKAREHFPVDSLFDWKAAPPVIKLFEKNYYVMFPIKPKYGGDKGILCLVFSQSVLNKEKMALIKSSRNKLAGAVVLTAVLIGILIKFFFVKPASRQVGLLVDLMNKDSDADTVAQIEVPEEIEAVHQDIARFIAWTDQSKSELSSELNRLAGLTDENSVAGYKIKLMQNVLERKQDEED
ncbi:MAG: hypothetical protein V3S16_03035 [Candidatus Desulfatibia sp.]|uniref:hypothetical protein n=1 Tax=Candidatus Desulfatibia sp. TaxID=3101189 RepID=UPI002F300E07